MVCGWKSLRILRALGLKHMLRERSLSLATTLRRRARKQETRRPLMGPPGFYLVKPLDVPKLLRWLGSGKH